MRYGFYEVVCFEKETELEFDFMDVVLKKFDVFKNKDLLGRRL